MSVFTQNKYTNIYFKIVQQAQTRDIVHEYVEKHHILPRSMGGGNEDSNIVAVTGREHFILHRLLVKMTTGHNQKKMIHAAWWMCVAKSSHGRDYQITSRTYAHLRAQHAVSAAETNSQNPERYKSPAFREKLSQSGKKRFATQPGTFANRKHSQETLIKMSCSSKGTGVGQANSQFGRLWITNGQQSIKINSQDPIPDGWRRGRVMPTQ